MAITAAQSIVSDFGDLTSGFVVSEEAEAIFEKAARLSVAQQLAQRIPLSYKGESIPVVSTRPAANWVSEGNLKPATQGAMTLKQMKPQLLAAIAVDSMQVVRANPGGYVQRMQNVLLPEAFAVAFDYAAFHNLGGDGTGTGPFGATNFIAATTKSTELGGHTQAEGGVYQDLNDCIAEIVGSTTAGRRNRLTGWALDPQIEPRLRGAVDVQGRPIFVDMPADLEASSLNLAPMRGSLLGRPSFIGEGVADPNGKVLGFGGDWTQAAWGAVGGINFTISTEGTVTINGSLVSLFEHNLIAIRAEAEYGFVVNDATSFIQLRNDSGS